MHGRNRAVKGKANLFVLRLLIFKDQVNTDCKLTLCIVCL